MSGQCRLGGRKQPGGSDQAGLGCYGLEGPGSFQKGFQEEAPPHRTRASGARAAGRACEAGADGSDGTDRTAEPAAARGPLCSQLPSPAGSVLQGQLKPRRGAGASGKNEAALLGLACKRCSGCRAGTVAKDDEGVGGHPARPPQTKGMAGVRGPAHGSWGRKHPPLRPCRPPPHSPAHHRGHRGQFVSQATSSAPES